MMNRTIIEWVKNPDGEQGYTWNPITGCLNHVNGYCKGGNFPCYAYRLANGRLKSLYLRNTRLAPKYKDEPLNICIEDGRKPFYPRFWPERLEQPFDIKGSAGIFPCDMSDLFGIGIPHEWTEAVMNVIKIANRHRFYLLTKQPQNLIKWEFPDNCWPGVTATNETMFHNACYYLEKVTVPIKYLSLEPLLQFREDGFNAERLNISGVSWVIIGALTGTKADLLPLHHKTGLKMVRLNGNRWSLQPQIEWVEEIVRAADQAGIPVFLKDNLRPLFTFVNHRWAWGKYSDGIWTGKLRQEMPE